MLCSISEKPEGFSLSNDSVRSRYVACRHPRKFIKSDGEKMTSDPGVRCIENLLSSCDRRKLTMELRRA
jgi:hypothetical protein